MSKLIDRREGQHLFGLNPQGYHDSRPDYPEWIYEQLRAQGALVPGTSTLEIGPGTGRATRRLLEYGANPLTLVEPDERFAAMLSLLTDESTADCRVMRQSFEDAELPAGQFDLVVAATSFHWVDQAPGLQKVRRLLSEHGVAALFWNVLQQLGKQDAFHSATRQLLADLAVSPSGAPGVIPHALDSDKREADALAAGFKKVDYTESRWTLELSTEQIGKLYESFAHIQRLDDGVRERLLSELMAIADTQFNGRVERNMTSCLYLLS